VGIVKVRPSRETWGSDDDGNPTNYMPPFTGAYAQDFPIPPQGWTGIVPQPDLEIDCHRHYPPAVLSVPWNVIEENLRAGIGVLKWPDK
jgi:hypothetical protein